MAEPKIGPINEFPFGQPLDKDDLGGLWAGFKVHKQIRRCSLSFGKELVWFGGEIQQMRQISTRMRQRIEEAWGRLSYNKTELPMRVRIIQGNIVQVHLPLPMTILVANPEVFLALAEVIDDRIKQAGLTGKAH